ncbi:MAG: hypothetical protein ABI398_04040 [Devosia sp.]
MSAKSGKVGVWPLLICWLLTAAAYVAKAIFTAGTTPLILDSDDAMRLNEVHDFLAGQNWFDLVQHRLNTPYGGELHWSRLIDLPEAALLLLLRPLAGGIADTVAAYLWPLLLLGLLLWLSAKLALRLGRREARWAALLLPAVSLIVMGEFAPGRFDHHSAQILLTLAMLYCAIASLDRPRFAIGAGLAAAAALAIGIEGLPIVAVTVIIFALMWVAAPRHATALRDFGFSFGLATALALAQGVAPARWFELKLDAISIVYVTAAALCGLAFVLLSLLPLRSLASRLVVALIAGAVTGAALLWLDPALLKGPYAALDPWLVQNWLTHVSESQTWIQSFIEDPVYPLGVTIPVLLALAFALWNIVQKKDRGAWLIVAAFLLVGLAVMLIQIRAARIVTPLAVPVCAALVATIWRRLVARPGLRPALAMVVAALGSAGLAVALLVAMVPFVPAPGPPASGNRQACLQPSAFTALAGQLPERIMAPVDLGSHLLLFTQHAVVGAPYHRNQQGLLDTFHFFNGPIEQGRDILAARGVGLVVICPAMSEIRGLVEHAPDSFVSLFAAGTLPDWLIDQSLPDSPLRVYVVVPR